MIDPMFNMPVDDLGDLLKSAAKGVESTLPPGTLFMILAFAEPKRCQYISNCHPSQRVEALREAADRMEAQEMIRKGIDRG